MKEPAEQEYDKMKQSVTECKQQLEEVANAKAHAQKKKSQYPSGDDFLDDCEREVEALVVKEQVLEGVLESREKMLVSRGEKRKQARFDLEAKAASIYGHNQAVELPVLQPMKVLKPGGTKPDSPPGNGDQPEKR